MLTMILLRYMLHILDLQYLTSTRICPNFKKKIFDVYMRIICIVVSRVNSKVTKITKFIHFSYILNGGPKIG